MERLQRNFIWGHNGLKSNFIQPIGWKQITRAKEYGGFGFRRLTSLNCAYGAKLAWRLVVGANGLWADILQQRYMLREVDSLLTFRPGDSSLWKFVCSHNDIIDLELNGKFVMGI